MPQIEPTVNVYIQKLFPDSKEPTRQTDGSAGYDAYAYIENHVIDIMKGDGTKERRQNDQNYFYLTSRSRALVSLGFKATFTPGYEAQIRPRSGRAWNDGLQVLNSPGTIDSDYPGEWKVMLYNPTRTNILILHGDRIAQVVFNKIETVKFEEVVDVAEITTRAGGFGSTGR